MLDKHLEKKRPIYILAALSFIIGFCTVLGVYQHTSSKQAQLLYSFFDSASKSTMNVNRYTMSYEELKKSQNLNFNPDYYHDGNSSIQDIIENFRVDLDTCKVEIERYHIFHPMGKEVTDYSLSSYLNPIYVHSLVFQCNYQNKDVAFIGYSFMRSDLLGMNSKIYKVIFPEF